VGLIGRFDSLMEKPSLFRLFIFESDPFVMEMSISMKIVIIFGKLVSRMVMFVLNYQLKMFKYSGVHISIGRSCTAGLLNPRNRTNIIIPFLRVLAKPNKTWQLVKYGNIGS